MKSFPSPGRHSLNSSENVRSCISRNTRWWLVRNVTLWKSTRQFCNSTKPSWLPHQNSILWRAFLLCEVQVQRNWSSQNWTSTLWICCSSFDAPCSLTSKWMWWNQSRCVAPVTMTSISLSGIHGGAKCAWNRNHSNIPWLCLAIL